MSGEMGGDMSGEMGGDMSGEMGGEMAGMREVESIDIPAGETVKLEKGGYHVMLMDVSTLEVGQKINITLTFEDSEGGTEDVTVQAEVIAV
ncbi:MAG: copper chaperone PCu(A)C [Actinobacteria bacterium ATB1]|nr:copper chaperone PCu(A)C [Actinobacteria bacterium ATB1]